jgi:hypothetical protein
MKFHKIAPRKETRPEIDKMVRWVGDRLQKLGACVEYCDIGTQTMYVRAG